VEFHVAVVGGQNCEGPEKKSQSIQLDRQGAVALLEII
jgi:hypothetical protein